MDRPATPTTSPVPERLSLDTARSHLTAAASALAGWYARQTTPAHTYVSDGQDAVRFIDELLRELYRVRAALAYQLRAGRQAEHGLTPEWEAELLAAWDAEADLRRRLGARLGRGSNLSHAS